MFPAIMPWPMTIVPSDYNPEMVGRGLSDLFKVLGLGSGATETKVKVQYQALSRIYHPDRHGPVRTGLTNKAAAKCFKLINNAQAYLQEII
jgi:DnaJ-class molecular chaperone